MLSDWHCATTPSVWTPVLRRFHPAWRIYILGLSSASSLLGGCSPNIDRIGKSWIISLSDIRCFSQCSDSDLDMHRLLIFRHGRRIILRWSVISLWDYRRLSSRFHAVWMHVRNEGRAGCKLVKRKMVCSPCDDICEGWRRVFQLLLSEQLRDFEWGSYENLKSFGCVSRNSWLK